MLNFRIVSVSHVGGKSWNIVYSNDKNETDFETVVALDYQEAYRKALHIITNKSIINE